VRSLSVLAVLLAVSRGVIALRPSRWLSSTLMGVAVFVVWVAPDLLFPGYREHWLFRNAFLGAAANGAPDAVRGNPVFLLFRAAGSALLVPVVEELFWRAWLMRRLIAHDFEKVPLGAYSAQSFWLTALLFASEHGAYWDVGLAAGIAYNWWMVRTRSLADCVLAHAVTNGCLAVYVLAAGQWHFWQ
jgi:CAAX prenyl protease-like protein